MMPRHHPDPEELLSYSAGSTPEWLSLVIACHLTYCSKCRLELELCEDIGGSLLDALGPDLLRPKILAAREDFLEGGRSASEANEGRGGTERPLTAEGRARNVPSGDVEAVLRSPRRDAPETRQPMTMPDTRLPRPLARYFADAKPRWRFLAPPL